MADKEIDSEKISQHKSGAGNASKSSPKSSSKASAAGSKGKKAGSSAKPAAGQTSQKQTGAIAASKKSGGRTSAKKGKGFAGTTISQSNGKTSRRFSHVHLLLAAIAAVIVGIIVNPFVAERIPGSIGRYIAPRQIDMSDDLSSLLERIEKIENEVADKAAASAVENISNSLSQISEQTTGLATRVADYEKISSLSDKQADDNMASEMLQKLQTELADLEKSLKDKANILAVQHLQTRLSDLDKKLIDNNRKYEQLPKKVEGIEERIKQLDIHLQIVDTNNQLTLALAFDTLEELAKSGRPFARHLRQLSELSALEPPQELTQIAEAGISTVKDIHEMFDEVKPAALDKMHAFPLPTKANPTEAETDQNQRSFTNIFKSWLGDRVTIRKIGEDAEGSPESIVAQIDTAFVQADLDKVYDTIQALPEETRAIFSEITAAIEQRVALEENFRNYRNQVIEQGETTP